MCIRLYYNSVFISAILARMVHTKCRNNVYPLSNVSRTTVNDDKVDWNVPWPEYKPIEYESNVVKNKPWADPDIGASGFEPKWNELDGNINRSSFEGRYELQENGRPLNIKGRTGIRGRGLLGRWGPNHAADPVVTRWKRSSDGQKIFSEEDKLAVLQFCAIQRRDSGEWAIPGGMVDPGEHVSQTLMREFMEEAINSLQASTAKLEQDKKLVGEFFNNGTEIYKGYVDDPRNTDNSWMETVAFNFHDDNGTSVGRFRLNAGDDAKNVKWIDVDRHLNLYASHKNMIEKVARLRMAHW